MTYVYVHICIHIITAYIILKCPTRYRSRAISTWSADPSPLWSYIRALPRNVSKLVVFNYIHIARTSKVPFNYSASCAVQELTSRLLYGGETCAQKVYIHTSTSTRIVMTEKIRTNKFSAIASTNCMWLRPPVCKSISNCMLDAKSSRFVRTLDCTYTCMYAYVPEMLVD